MTTEGCVDVPFLSELFASFTKQAALTDEKALDDTEDVNSTQYLTSVSSVSDLGSRRELGDSDGGDNEVEDLSTGFLDGMERAEAIVEGADHGNKLVDAREVSRKHFEGAMDGSQVLASVVKRIEPMGFTPENTLYAQSVCPDEINHEEGDITNIFAEYMGEVFHLGGLAGLPFSGRTGFSAFTHHVPDGGHCFVLMAPHIGISETHALGKYTRDGQGDHEGAACGAAIGAFAHCECGKRMPPASADALDYQMNFIIRKVNKVKQKILDECETQDEKMVALVHEIWKVGKSMMLDDIVHAHYGDENSKLLVLTGIQINMPRPYEDMFQPLSFTMYQKDKPNKKEKSKKGGNRRRMMKKKQKPSAESNDPKANTKIVDLFEETFGRKAPVLSKTTKTTEEQ